MLNGKKVVLGVTGGIAVYKAADVVSRLKKLGAEVYVIMTKAAAEFVTPLTFQTMSQNYVVTDMFGEIPSWDVEHIALAKKADLFLVVPATANLIGKVANGIADDMLSTTIMATRARVVFAPAMNTNMYTNPIFQQNVEKLKKLGYNFIAPASGRLACGDVGEGKLEDPERIVEHVAALLSVEKDLEGKRVVVTAGPTIAKLDPVRYMTNHSSGKMGYEIAKAAQRRGASVTLISGPTGLDRPENIEFVGVSTTSEMLEAVKSRLEQADVIVKAAAPLDYKPKEYSEQKIKKNSDTLSVDFEKDVDIARSIGKIKREDQILVGFAAESTDLEANARKKIETKNLNFIVANDITSPDTGFKSDYNEAKIIKADGTVQEVKKTTKAQMADIIVDNIVSEIEAKAR